MRRLVPYLSMLLLALWLPATQHCAMEAIGLITRTCADDCATANKTDIDGCGLLESGAYKPSVNVAKLVAPLLLVCLCFEYAPLLRVAPTADEISPSEAFERPRDWVSAWNFVRRAAPPSRAPTPVFA